MLIGNDHFVDNFELSGKGKYPVFVQQMLPIGKEMTEWMKQKEMSRNEGPKCVLELMTPSDTKRGSRRSHQKWSGEMLGCGGQKYCFLVLR
jgi:hypothetical protein